jgi:hypothetical protein
MGISRNKNARQERHAIETMTFDLSSAIELIKNTNDKDESLSNCLSMEEICEKLNISIDKTRKVVKQCFEQGIIEFAGKRNGEGIDGRITKVPVYRFKDKKKKK